MTNNGNSTNSKRELVSIGQGQETVSNTTFPVSSTESVETQQITTFEDATSAIGFEYPNKANVSDLQHIDTNHTILQFLQRPVLMFDSVITTTTPLIQIPTKAASQVPVFSFSLPGDLLKLGFKAEKVSKFEYFKADIRIKVTINANNMTAGRFFLTYAPYDNLIQVGYRQRDKHAAGVTSYPGVELDIQTNNTVEILVPYLHWAEALSLTSNSAQQHEFAVVSLFALSALRSTASYGITVQAWGWFENITLVGPTTDNPVGFYQSEEYNVKEKLYATYTKAKMEMQIQAEASSGPISSIAATVSGVADMVSGLPIVGEVAKTVGWVADLVGGVASIFGWSKPINMDRVNRYENIPGYGYSHYDSIDNSVVLGMTASNELGKPLDVFPTNDDEMSISHVAANPGMIRVFPWGAKDVKGTQLARFVVSVTPDTDRRVETGPNRTRAEVCCEYISELFRLWRGTLVFRVSVVKTAYHTGRLELLFVPNKGTDLASTLDTSNVYRYILDITNESEITIKIPFISEALLLEQRDSIGSFYIRTITQLHAPEVVSDTVDVVVWKWAENLVLSQPVSTWYVPYPLPATKTKFEMQINVGNLNSGKEISFFPGNDNPRDIADVCQKVSGEAIISLRILLRMFRYSRKLELKANQLNQYNPFDDAPGDYVNYLAQMYRFCRGGINLKIFTDGVGGRLTSFLSFGTQNLSPSVLRPPSHVTYNALNPIHQISIPFYSKYRKVPTVPVQTAGVGQIHIPGVSFLSTTDQSCDLMRATKDDFSLGCLVGPPMLLLRLSPEE